MDTTLTFGWQGERITWLGDLDNWSLRELQHAEAVAERPLGELTATSFKGIVACVSIARATGQRISAVHAGMTFGHVALISDELDAQVRELRAREAERLAAEAAEAERAAAAVEFTGHGAIGAAGAADGAQEAAGAVPFPGSEQEGGPEA